MLTLVPPFLFSTDHRYLFSYFQRYVAGLLRAVRGVVYRHDECLLPHSKMTLSLVCLMDGHGGICVHFQSLAHSFCRLYSFPQHHVYPPYSPIQIYL